MEVRGMTEFEKLNENEAEEYAKQWIVDEDSNALMQEAFKDGAEFGYNKANEWHKLDWEKDFPEADKLIRVRLRSGMEHICETCYYEPTEDEIGYGKLVISFYELNGEWVDDNDVLAWCYIEPFKESE
jgi:hypothetical protein